MELEEVIKNRFSCRKFSDKVVEKEKLNKILEAGRLAPTAKNNQPIKIYVIQSEEAISKLDKGTICRYGAKTVLLICGDKEKAFQDGEYSSYEMDASIVTTHMMLEATNLGVDNIWIRLFDGDILRKEFDIPSNFIPVCLLPIGYKIEECIPSRLHETRKNIDEIVKFI
ncbi:MAG: nitroreductase family protein [Clostridia bacterium]|nr:nitroreductase family protein [Clostridia bacterium]